MVCLGNICRSPLAQAILQHKINAVGLPWQVHSAGTNGLHNGQAPHPLSQQVAALHGLTISHQVSRRITMADMQHYDYIVVLANDVLNDVKHIMGNTYNADKVLLLLNILHPGTNQDVPDPYYGGIAGYYKVYNILDEACNALLTKLISHSI